MNTAAAIAVRFGGSAALARALGKPYRTVHSWVEAGVIPAQHQAAVLVAGQALDPPLTPADFFTKETINAATQKDRRGTAAD